MPVPPPVRPVLVSVRASVLAGLLVAQAAACGDPCTNTERARIPSPDGRREAVVFGRACGGRTGTQMGVSAQVALVAPGERAIGVGNVFAAERDVPVTVRWEGPTALVVRYRDAGEVGTRPQLDDVRLRYDSLDVP